MPDTYCISVPMRNGDVEAWVVNTLKIRMIVQLDDLLVGDGKKNARTLLLVPVFTIAALVARVREYAPEMQVFLFRELGKTIEEAHKRFS